MQSLSHENYKSGLTFTAVSSKNTLKPLRSTSQLLIRDFHLYKQLFVSGIRVRSPKEILSWQKLSAVKKRGHSLTNCKGCHLDHSSTQALFPVNSTRLKGKGKENPCLLAKPLAKKVKHASKAAVKEVTKKVYNQLNTVYKKWAGETFAQALCNIPEAEVEKKKTNHVKKQERRNIIRQGKRAIEKKWQDTSFVR